jgi:hypothetical protein
METQLINQFTETTFETFGLAEKSQTVVLTFTRQAPTVEKVVAPILKQMAKKGL